MVYRDGTGRHLQRRPCATCTAIINTPGGGASRNVRRPNLIPGVDPYLKDGLQWLNPAAFAIPAPGEFGNLKRGAARGPSFTPGRPGRLEASSAWQGPHNVELRVEVFNLFNRTNYAPAVRRR